MVYPEEFKQKVLAAFGDNENIKRHLDSGSEVLGRILDDASYGSISPEELVKAVDSNNIKVLYEKAQKLMALRALYREWSELDNKQYEEARSPHM